MQIYIAIEEKNIQRFIENFKLIGEKVQLMIITMNDMYKWNEPSYFFNKLRPFLFGFQEGVYFEGVDKIVREGGGSAGQDPAFHIFESALGLVYDGTHKKRCQALRRSTIKIHRKQMRFYEENSRLREFAKENLETKEAYNNVLKLYAKFFKVFIFILSHNIFF